MPLPAAPMRLPAGRKLPVLVLLSTLPGVQKLPLLGMQKLSPETDMRPGTNASNGLTPAESKTRTYHGRVGAGRRTARRRGQAVPGWRGRRRFGSPRRHLSLVPTRVAKTTVQNVSSEARTKEFLCKPAEEQNPRLTRGSSAFHQRDRERSSFPAADQCADAYLSL